MSQKIIADTRSVWLHHAIADVVIGCGAWTLPLFALLAVGARSYAVGISVVFYGLSLVINYPHYMATIYRAYNKQNDFKKYRRYTVFATLLIVLVLILGHFSYRILPWVFTLYVIWNPWHYSGQNYGLASMFMQRAGFKPEGFKRWCLQMVFVSSYAMLAIGFLSQASVDPIVISFGLPFGVTKGFQWALSVLFLFSTIVVIATIWKQIRGRNRLAPLTLISTQVLWFVLPVIYTLVTDYQFPPTRYSSGILAILHSAQYLWITTYFSRKESAKDQSTVWSSAKYALVLIAGGVALFLPGPWLVSLIGHYDFASSFFFFTALVNIHHFLLDGAVWKLRDPDVASILVGNQVESEKKIDQYVARKPASRLAFGIAAAAAVLLISLGVTDLYRFYLGAYISKPANLARAAKLNPNDAMLQVKLAQSEIRASNVDSALDAMRKAVELNPKNPVTQNSLAQLLVENERYVEALRQYQNMRRLGMMDVNALVNYGILAQDNKQFDEAIASWTQALKIDPNQLNARLYLAEILNQQGQTKASIVHYEKYLTLLGLQGGSAALTPEQVAHVASKLADAYEKEDCRDCKERAREYRKKADQFTALAKDVGRR